MTSLPDQFIFHNFSDRGLETVEEENFEALPEEINSELMSTSGGV